MRHCFLRCLFVLALCSPASAQIGGCVPDTSNPTYVSVQTALGDMLFELYPAMAPGTVQNFLQYMNDGDYQGVLFHRSVPGFVVQGGGYRAVAGDYESIPRDAPILNEPCLSNTRGTLAMARLGGDPDSASSEWFVNLVDNLFLDATDGVGFTAFGRVREGMAVADAIAALPITDTAYILELPINQIFSDLPVQSVPADPPAGYGCSRASPLFGLVDPTQSFIEADPLRNGSGTAVPILADPICSGANASGPPSIPCTEGVGRVVINWPSAALPLFPMTCAALAESEDSWSARRVGWKAQLIAEDVEVTAMPEPGQGMLAAGLLLLVVLGRFRARPASPMQTLGSRYSPARGCRPKRDAD